MTRSEFAIFVEHTLEQSIQFAEQESGRTLPRRIAFAWLGRDTAPIREGIVEEIVNRVFVDDEHIYPCVDIGPSDLLEDGSLLIKANVAGYKPEPFGKNWTGTDGPFIYMVSSALMNCK